MKKMNLALLLISFSSYLLAQKQPLDLSACQNFSQIGSAKISSDGKYVFYSVNNVNGSTSQLCLKYVNSAYEKQFVINSPNVNVDFTNDSHWMLFTLPGDSLGLVDLKNRRTLYITKCRSFKISKNGDGRWLSYHLTNNNVVVQNLSTGEKRLYPNAEDYSLSNSGKVLLIKSKSNTEIKGVNSLLWIDLVNGTADTVWKGSQSNGYTFDLKEGRLAFLSVDTAYGENAKAIWFYRKGMKSAELLINTQTDGMAPGMSIGNYELKFSPKADKIFFNIIQSAINNLKPDSTGASVDVWSNKDQYLQEEQLRREKYTNASLMLSVFNFTERKVTILKKKDDAFISHFNEGDDDNFLLVSAAKTWEGYSGKADMYNMCLVNTQNGTRECKETNFFGNNTSFSPGGKYLCWYDIDKRAYFTYDLRSSVTRNITKFVKSPVYDELWDKASPPFPYSSKPIWLENDEAILICDRYDIWQVDPTGIKQPINITNEYGRNNKIVLRCIYRNSYGSDEPPIKKNAILTLSAFNENTKDNGFFRLSLQTGKDPEKLVMSANVYYFPENFSQVSFSTFLRKAEHAETYLLKKGSATDFPNLVATKDFKKFIQISKLVPQKKYNWLTSELVRWETFNGKVGTGILYKPENFNPQMKYPIIFYFYERLSDGLNLFPEPGLSSGPMNIPYFVSQGYLVFCPDIHYTIGQPGESAYNYVVSAAKMMAEKPFIDRNRMGIQGHSFGGYEVNYLITRTNIFAAACSAAGPTDLISASGVLIFNSSDAHSFYENEQMRLGSNLWQDLRVYINSSPLFGVNKVVTPLLMMHNKNDENVPWFQSLEFFTSMRRLGKTVWMLQYDNEGHTLSNDINQLDYSTRVKEFFDHYLKGVFAPKWMTQVAPTTATQIQTSIK